MYLLGLGIVLLALKYLEIGPVADCGLVVGAVAVCRWRVVVVGLGRLVRLHQEEGDEEGKRAQAGPHRQEPRIAGHHKRR